MTKPKVKPIATPVIAPAPTPPTIAQLENPQVKMFNCTDTGNSELFASLYKGKVLYDHLRGKWFLWTGVRWREDDSSEIMRLAKDVPRRRRQKAEEIEGTDDSAIDARRKHFNWSMQSEHLPKVRGMLDLARSHKLLADSGKSWDMDHMLLGMENGILDLRTGLLIEPRPELRITKSTGLSYDPTSECPNWISTIEKMWPTRTEIREYVMRVLGYSITGSTNEQALFCYYGEGRNGKNTLLDTVGHVLGEYAYTMPFAVMEMVGRNTVSNDLAALHGRRFVMASETQEDMRLNEGRIKSWTGDAQITARFLYKENFSFPPIGKLHLGFNHKPVIRDDSYGMWRRIKLIFVEGQFKDATEIKGYAQSVLHKEAQGILNWLVKGCLNWQIERGILTPSVVQEETEQYRQESNPLTEFLEERCVVASELRVRQDELWENYLDWVRMIGEKYPLGRRGFGARMVGKGFKNPSITVKGERLRVWEGLSTKLRGPGTSEEGILADEGKIN